MTTPRLNGGTSTPGVALTRTERRPAGDNRSPRVGRYGSTDPDASQRRWRVRRVTRPDTVYGYWWEVTDPDCTDLGKLCRCTARITGDDALAYVAWQIDREVATRVDVTREVWEPLRLAVTGAWDSIRAAFVHVWAALAELTLRTRFTDWDDIVNDAGWPTPEALYPNEPPVRVGRCDREDRP